MMLHLDYKNTSMGSLKRCVEEESKKYQMARYGDASIWEAEAGGLVLTVEWKPITRKKNWVTGLSGS